MARLGFHDVLFPLEIGLGARGGPERKTDIVQLASGSEVRRARWAHSKRSWDVGSGVQDFAAAEAVLHFFEERQGRRYSFRFRDPFDYSSSPGGGDPLATDQILATGDGSITSFALRKNYGSVLRPIDLAVEGSVHVAVDGVDIPGTEWVLSEDRDAIVFSTPPLTGTIISAGYLFDVPCRFLDDRLQLRLQARGAGLPSISLVEVKL